MIAEDFIQRFSNKTCQSVFFARLHDATLSRSQYGVTSFIDFSPYKNIFTSLIEYANGLKRSLHHYADIKRYSQVKSDLPITYEEKSGTQSFHKLLAECIEEVKLISALVTNLQSQFIRILDLISDSNSSADKQEPQKSKKICFWQCLQMVH